MLMLIAVCGAPVLAQEAGPVVSEFDLAEVADAPHGRTVDSVFYCNFDEGADADYARGNGRCAAIGGGGSAQGRWGQALACTAPDGLVVYNMERNIVARAGTLELWVRSAEGNIWADDQDRELLHLSSGLSGWMGDPDDVTAEFDARRRAISIEVTRLGADGAVHLLVHRGRTAPLDLSVPAADLSADDWHHVAISWDLRAQPALLWLTIDGAGAMAQVDEHMEPLPFTSLQLGNYHRLGDYQQPDVTKPLGGWIDDLHISDETLARRAAGYDGPRPGAIDEQFAMDAQDALRRWVDLWAELQTGGTWASWVFPRVNDETRLFFHIEAQPWPVSPMQAATKYGHPTEMATRFLRIWEATGDERCLQVAKNSAEFFLRAQQPEGHWLTAYLVDESGRVVPAGGSESARSYLPINDSYQNAPFVFLLDMYRATGDGRCFDAARRCADMLLEIENENGSWPGVYLLDRQMGVVTHTWDTRSGGEYNDGATSNPLRMMITMYHLTGDEKYIRGTHGAGPGGIGQWLFDTQLGEGDVRGWAQQYDDALKPAWARAFEAPLIRPWVLPRYVAPMCQWFHLMTGDERYVELTREAVAWLRSVEVPGEAGGWYDHYQPDGTPVHAAERQVIPLTGRDPSELPAGARPDRKGTDLTEAERWLQQLDELGPEAYGASLVRPVELTADELAERVLGAAETCRRLEAEQALREAVRSQRADGAWIEDDPQVGHKLAYAPPSRLLYYVISLSLARGVLPADTIATGGSGPWGPAGTWHGPPIADWFDVPIEP